MRELGSEGTYNNASPGRASGFRVATVQTLQAPYNTIAVQQIADPRSLNRRSPFPRRLLLKAWATWLGPGTAKRVTSAGLSLSLCTYMCTQTHGSAMVFRRFYTGVFMGSWLDGFQVSDVRVQVSQHPERLITGSSV